MTPINYSPVFWDVNGKGGKDCTGHGSMVSSAAAGSTYGVAKGATLIMAKITDGCTGDSYVSTSVLAFNWLAENAPAGTIVNLSYGILDIGCKINWHSSSLENAIKKAHDAGIIVVVAAGNDGCNTKNHTPTNMPEAFVVGSTDKQNKA
jgi:serine protease